jgi:hypothetical protein
VRDGSVIGDGAGVIVCTDGPAFVSAARSGDVRGDEMAMIAKTQAVASATGSQRPNAAGRRAIVRIATWSVAVGHWASSSEATARWRLNRQAARSDLRHSMTSGSA